MKIVCNVRKDIFCKTTFVFNHHHSVLNFMNKMIALIVMINLLKIITSVFRNNNKMKFKLAYLKMIFCVRVSIPSKN